MALPVIPFRDITIVDPFAGMGKDDNGEKGSALIAYEAIKEKMPDFIKTHKLPHLELNEFDGKRFAKLKENVPADIFVRFSSNVADNFISDISSRLVGHSLFFIDPFGYSQISKDTYDRCLFGKYNTDILIFIPIYHIYRFLRKKENSEQLKPIAAFLKDIDISESNATSVRNYQEFTNVIRVALKAKANTQFVYYKMINNEKTNSHYALFYISRNILGAEKFLESIDRMRQPNLLYSIMSEPEQQRFINGLQKMGVLNNCQIYQAGIICGLLPKEVRTILKSLENEGKIVVKPCDGYERKRKGFPIDYSDYTARQAKFEILWVAK